VNGNGLDAYETLMRAMNIAQDPGAFERLVENIGIGYVVEGRLGTRVPQTLSLFDGLIWAITGQQINLPFAFALRQRLFAKYGEPLGDDLYAVPSPDRLAEADPSELKGIQFSRQKADYLIGIARLGSGWLRELEEASFSRARAMLFTARGLGVWSANYILMRALGYPDCVPLGDTGLTSGLVQLHNLREKPTHSQIESMMQTFAPHRSLATYHLWQSLK
jgi:AraC family transcriptional regulator of adaptative response / DNA-3-methyladenine glycosylase II